MAAVQSVVPMAEKLPFSAAVDLSVYKGQSWLSNWEYWVLAVKGQPRSLSLKNSVTDWGALGVMGRPGPLDLEN